VCNDDERVYTSLYEQLCIAQQQELESELVDESAYKEASDDDFLADRTATRLIGYWHNPVVCPSVCLFVTLYIVALGVGVQG